MSAENQKEQDVAAVAKRIHRVASIIALDAITPSNHSRAEEIMHLADMLIRGHAASGAAFADLSGPADDNGVA